MKKIGEQIHSQLARMENNSIEKLKDHPLMKPPAYQQAKNDIFSVVMMSIAKCYADLNQKIPDNEAINYLCNGVTDSIMEKYPSVRLHEVPMAFSNGIRKHYGEYYGLSVVTFELFLEGYINSDARLRLAAEKEIIGPRLKLKCVPTLDEQFELSKETVLSALNNIKNGKSIVIISGVCYDFLEFIELLNFTSREKWGIIQTAIKVALIDLERDVSDCMDIFKRRNLRTNFEAFKASVDAENDLSEENSRLVLKTAKRLVVIKYLRDVIDGGINLGEIIDTKKDLYMLKCQSK